MAHEHQATRAELITLLAAITELAKAKEKIDNLVVSYRKRTKASKKKEDPVIVDAQWLTRYVIPPVLHKFAETLVNITEEIDS